MAGFKTIVSAVLLCLAASVQPCHAKCGAMLRSINWDGRKTGDYGTGQMANDFSPYNYMRGTQHTKIKPIGGREYLQVSLKKGCYGTDSSRGCGLYGRMPASPGKKPKTMTLEYTMRFGPGFDWVRGGKLPGLCAGQCPTGCDKSISPNEGFSARIMWTDNECQGKPKGCKKGKSGGMHIYAYYSNMQGNKGCGDEYTFKSGSKAMVVKANKDYRVQLVVKLNSGNKANGYMKAYMNGRLVAKKTGAKLASKNMSVDSIMWDNFFGGSSDMAARKNENLYFKNMYAWEGDCNGKSGSKKKLQRSSGSGGGSAGGWKAYTIDKKSYKNKSAMKTRNLSVDTIFNGGFCATFTSKNEGRSTCRDFAVELNLNPNTFTLQKHTTSLRKISENKGKGHYLFGRSGGLNKETSPGTERKGQFCAISKVKALYTRQQIESSFTVNSICNGESMSKSLSAVKP